jgi:hypothetical protein
MNLVRSSPFKVLSAIEFQTAVASFPDISLSAGLRLKTRSQRTKAALSAAKARGQKLGNPNISAAREAGATALKANADRHAANVLPIIAEIQKSGAKTLRAIAEALNAQARAPGSAVLRRNPPTLEWRLRLRVANLLHELRNYRAQEGLRLSAQCGHMDR